ncbi:MAG TPA: transglycosylase domain-containing protein [Candidatus Dormibacteraeota bacterium]|nr:transglycosylase domain-containing protein [Candidatus Dormibacteraeota bacterium]
MASAFGDLRVSDRLAARRRAHRQVHRWRKRARRDVRRALILGLVVVVLIPLMGIPAVTAQAVGPLPSVSGLSSSGIQQDTLIYDRHGTLLADIGKEGDHRIVVPLNYISPWLTKATLATEDRTFYKNSGIDVGGIFRAALADYQHKAISQGGSTISQQLVKQVYIGANPAPTIQRKLKEAILAVELNREYTKNQILEMYLNTIYYGSQTYGVEAAARSYFHTNAHDLSLAQAAMIAGLPQAPTRYNPLTAFASARARQAQVLAGMVGEKYITASQAQAAYTVPLQVFPPTTSYTAPYFVDYVLKTLAKPPYNISADDRRGYRVYTSLDLNLQTMAEKVVREQVAQKGNYYNFHDAALVSMDPKTGEVLAMVGGVDYNRPGGQFNLAYDKPRPPGSSFKIFTYTAAIESRKVNMVSPILDDAMVFPNGGDPVGLGKYAPQNYDHRFHGTLPLKMAMGNSLNIPALKVELRTGIPAVIDMAHRLGLTCLGEPCNVDHPDNWYGPSLTLGAYPVRLADMATSASTLATLGVRHREAPILNIKDGLGRDVFTYDPARNEFRAVEQGVAFIIASIMSDDRNRCMEFGCHGDLTLAGRHVAAKTGTTNDFKDNWTVGFTPSLATAVWVGNPDNKPLSHNSTGIVGAAPIWHKFMTQALAGKPDEWYQVPAGIHPVGENYFLPGTENLPPTLAQPWPVCKLPANYSPYTLTYAQTVVDGVLCVINAPKPPPAPPAPAPTPAPTPSCVPNPGGQCKPND